MKRAVIRNMSDIKDVNFQDEPLAGDYRVPTPKGIKNTNGEEWVCDEGEHEQPYPIVNEAGYITLADQHMIERDEKEALRLHQLGEARNAALHVMGGEELSESDREIILSLLEDYLRSLGGELP